MLKYGIFLLFSITLAFAKIADFTKNAYRSFNEIEGKIPVINLTIAEDDLTKIKEAFQLSIMELIMDYGADASKLPSYETKVNMTFEVDGKVQKFKKVELKTGGNWARIHDKIGLNLKLKKNDKLLNRKSFRLRGDPTDFSSIRMKLALDLLNNWNMVSVQASYVELYVNNEYYGLNYLIDAIRPNWVKNYYKIEDDREIETLYHCKSDGMDFTMETVSRCKNENSETANYTEPLETLVKNVVNCKTLSELDKYIDTDLLTKYAAVEFLYGSYDHLLSNGHNFYLYQPSENERWQIIEYDFDSEFGNGIKNFISMAKNMTLVDYGTQLVFDNFLVARKHIFDLIYFNNNSYFVKKLRDLLVTGFNPVNLFPRIDELVEFIAPYVEKTFTPNANGKYPGAVNEKGVPSAHTMKEFYGNTEYTVASDEVPGVKHWIQNRFDFVCKEFGFDKEEILKEAKLKSNTFPPVVRPTAEDSKIIEEPATTTVPVPKPTTSVPEPTKVPDDEDSEEEIAGELENEDDSDDEEELAGELENEDDSDDEEELAGELENEDDSDDE